MEIPLNGLDTASEAEKEKSASDIYAEAVLSTLSCDDIQDPIEKKKALQDWGGLSRIVEEFKSSSGEDREIKVDGLNSIISSPDVQSDIKADIIAYIGIAGNTLDLEPGIASLEAAGVTDPGLQAQLEFYHSVKPISSPISSGEPQSSL
jgi:hypothetical protein